MSPSKIQQKWRHTNVGLFSLHLASYKINILSTGTVCPSCYYALNSEPECPENNTHQSDPHTNTTKYECDQAFAQLL
jgi:hypothetical protein